MSDTIDLDAAIDVLRAARQRGAISPGGELAVRTGLLTLPSARLAPTASDEQRAREIVDEVGATSTARWWLPAITRALGVARQQGAEGEREAWKAAFISHVDGRNLLDEVCTDAHHIDIHVRRNGQAEVFEGDWLKRLRVVLHEVTSLLQDGNGEDDSPNVKEVPETEDCPHLDFLAIRAGLYTPKVRRVVMALTDYALALEDRLAEVECDEVVDEKPPKAPKKYVDHDECLKCGTSVLPPPPPGPPSPPRPTCKGTKVWVSYMHRNRIKCSGCRDCIPCQKCAE